MYCISNLMRVGDEELFSRIVRSILYFDEEVLDEVYASNGSKPAPDYSRPKRSKRSKRKHAV
ncbi:hypothetical protein ACSBR1_017024 [Camellia fascicularis]